MKPKRSFRGNSQLIASLIAGFLLAAPALWLILSAVNHSRNLKAFVYELSLATIYATENDSLKATQDGQEIRVEHNNAFTIFAQFTKKRAKPQRRTPEGEPALCLDYGNGALLECWEVRLEETAARKHGVFWRFTAPDGRVWMYDSDAFSILLLKNAAALSTNAPW
ncbi:MAG: hypothetical protein IJD98_03785 [Oscillospiraceae bacterium]|nr:hypothetical protein [Oscillospiraceae bacterium]